MPTIDPDYPTARAGFLAACRRAGVAPTTYEHPLPGRSGEPLGTDVAVVGDPAAEHAVFVVSGTHGVEGYAGSMLQTEWLRGRAVPPSSTKVILVHAINPYGFSFDRRVTEDNVDLNRNFVDWSSPPVNTDYDTIASVVVPQEWTPESQEASLAALIDVVAEIGMEATQDAIARGQYAHPHGVFYGGTRPTWSHTTLKRVLQTDAASAGRVTIVDVHTGLGAWGSGELISAEPPNASGYGRAAAVWGQVASMVSGGSVSTPVTGEWFSPVTTWLPAATVTAVALEFGTVDTMQVIQALRADAWRSGASNVDPAVDEQIRLQLRAVFLDDDPAWASALWDRFADVLDAALVPPVDRAALSVAPKSDAVSS